MTPDTSDEKPVGRIRLMAWASAFCIFVIAATLGYRSWIEAERRDVAPMPVLHAVPDFSLTDQTGAEVTRESLRGKIWIADFFFTRCTGPCPLLTARMFEIQKALARTADVKLVSVSVDPAYDTPEVLREYGARFGADPEKWKMLTGNPAVVRKLVKEGFLQMLDEDGAEPVHGTMFLLVDGNGMVRGIYGLDDPEMLQKVLTDAGNLLRAQDRQP